MALLEAKELSIRFGGVQALDDVSIVVREWEIVGIIGPNGAGKTTAFNCVTGFYRPDAGRVLLKGEDVTAKRVHERAAMGMARTFQNVGLVRTLSVLENLLVAFHRHIRYTPIGGFAPMPHVLREERQLRDNALEILRFLGLAELKDAMVEGLPYGTLKLIELGQALCTDPELLLLDEPTSGMGPEEAHAVGRTLRRLRDELGLTIALIEHHVPLVVDVCDYVYCLNFGRVLAEGDPHSVRTDPEVVTAYLGEEAA